MARRYEVDLTIESARNLKNVNWRNGPLNPYVVVWIDPAVKSSSKVAVDYTGDADDEEGTNPVWDQKLTIPLPPDQPLEDAVLHLDVVHAGSGSGEGKVKPLVGSARLPLRDVLDEAGIGAKVSRSLKLKRPSGRPHGKIQIKVAVKEPARYYDPYAAPPPMPYGQPAGASSRDYYSGSGAGGGYGYGQPYGAQPPAGYPYGGAAPPPSGYPYGAAPAPAYGYGASAPGYGYGASAPAYGYAEQVPVGEKKSKFGLGTGLAVGAAAGVLGGLALGEGIDYVEDKIADEAAERVEDDLADDYGGDDF